MLEDVGSPWMLRRMNLWHDSAIVCKKKDPAAITFHQAVEASLVMFSHPISTAPFVFNAGYIGYVAEEMRNGAAKREGAEAQHFASDRVFKQHQYFN